MGNIEDLELETALSNAQARALSAEADNARLKLEVARLQAEGRSLMLQTHHVGPPIIIEIVPARPRPILTTNTAKGRGLIQTHGRPEPDEKAAQKRLIETITAKRRATPAVRKGK